MKHYSYDSGRFSVGGLEILLSVSPVSLPTPQTFGNWYSLFFVWQRADRPTQLHCPLIYPLAIAAAEYVTCLHGKVLVPRCRPWMHQK